MTYWQYKNERLSVIDSLLRYLPFCETQSQQESILGEIARLRRIVREIEEMTKAEAQKKVKFKKMTIESCLNIETDVIESEAYVK